MSEREIGGRERHRKVGGEEWNVKGIRLLIVLTQQKNNDGWSGVGRKELQIKIKRRLTTSITVT